MVWGCKAGRRVMCPSGCCREDKRSGWHWLCSCIPHPKCCKSTAPELRSAVAWQLTPIRVLDEVTTHLDAYSIRALARGLRDWDGAIVLITHDR